jgi:uncharacterized protein
VIELEVYSVLYSLLSRHRVVLLKELSGERYLPIWIGQHESEAIAMRLQGAAVPRPMTHDLLNSAITELGGALQYIIVSDLSNGTFFAQLAIEQSGQIRMIDSRPSDAIALAVRAEVAIYSEDEVLNQAGILPSPDIRPTPEEGGDLDVFREFIENLDLDDQDSEPSE